MNFRILLVTLVLSAMSFSSIAQTDVTFRVDVTNYAMGATIDPTGIRVGGNFADHGAMNGANAMVNWTPTDANSALVDLGNNIWEITVTFPAVSVGDTLQYKFVNGDWGMNEGVDTNAIAAGGCGLDDGSGNINRIIEIPAAGDTVTFCWDRCESTCAATGISELDAISSTSVFPNPVSESATIEFSLSQYADNLSVTIYNAIGSEVSTLFNESASAGQYTLNWNGSSDNGTQVQSGVYFVVVKSDEAVRSERILVAGK
ncbi:MAG: T9SS type A sorting domain-containing protein [Chitinophagales bacterium]|nr:T9SS type A sorting domain-containing protein [Chitinophagales bacterium]